MRRDFMSDIRLTLIRRSWVFTFLGLSFTLCTVHVWGSVYSFVFFMLGSGMWLISVPATASVDDLAPSGAAPVARIAQSHARDLAPAVARSGAVPTPGLSADRPSGMPTTRFAQTRRRLRPDGAPDQTAARTRLLTAAPDPDG